MNINRTIVVERDNRALTTRVIEVLENQPELEAAAAAAIAAAAAAAQDAADAAGDAADAQQAAEDAEYFAGLAIGTPSYQTRAEVEAMPFPSSVQALIAEGKLFTQFAAGTDLVTADGKRWRQVRAYDQFPSEFTRTTDPAMLRAAIGMDAVRDNSIVNGSHVLDATMFAPNMTVYSGNGTFSHLVDVSTATMGQVYPIFNAGSFGDLVTLDCGEELSFVGAGAHPAVTTRKQVTIEAGTVAFISRASINKVWIWLEGSYWAQPNANTFCRLAHDGTYDVRYLRTGSIAATTEVNDIVLPTWLSLNSAIVQAVTFQPDPSGAAPGAAIPLVITKMGALNSLAANRAAIYNPNASAVNRPVVIHFTNVLRA